VTYTGCVSNGNTRKINYKSKKTMIMPVADRIIIENMHTPIIDKETFDIVQDLIKSRTGVRTKSYDWLLKGLVCCKECGRKLSLIPQKYPNKTTFYLRCNTYVRNTGLGLCTLHSNNLEKVTDYVIDEIRKRCNAFLSKEEYAKIADKSMKKRLNDRFNLKNEIIILEKKIKDINKKIDRLFEDKYKGLFEDEDFTRVYSMQIQLRKDSECRIKQLKELEHKEGRLGDINKLVKDFVESKEITREMIISLVDKIEISESKEITIYYKFNVLNMINDKTLKNAG
jgi:hypothetical protein